MFWLDGYRVLQELRFYENDTGIAEAVRALIAGLEAEVPFVDAVQSFCMEILEGKDNGAH